MGRESYVAPVRGPLFCARCYRLSGTCSARDGGESIHFVLRWLAAEAAPPIRVRLALVQGCNDVLAAFGGSPTVYEASAFAKCSSHRKVAPEASFNSQVAGAPQKHRDDRFGFSIASAHALRNRLALRFLHRKYLLFVWHLCYPGVTRSRNRLSLSPSGPEAWLRPGFSFQILAKVARQRWRAASFRRRP